MNLLDRLEEIQVFRDRGYVVSEQYYAAFYYITRTRKNEEIVQACCDLFAHMSNHHKLDYMRMFLPSPTWTNILSEGEIKLHDTLLYHYTKKRVAVFSDDLDIERYATKELVKRGVVRGPFMERRVQKLFRNHCYYEPYFTYEYSSHYETIENSPLRDFMHDLFDKYEVSERSK
ncbi:hypothetical protein [Kurthia sp. Dielmo]|uniref:hypothetical protein n=1 Tax=Kurthia sp. Dielmo TaxID=1033738 RepID=UPI0011210BF6|nr:hypothetical protein [Kurthia sp. Dielmo]